MADQDEIRRALAAWWHAQARDLPWRFGRATPWGVLVSEVMSQQTQMSRVVPYWQAWMRVWPDAAALAGASTAEVITAWGRLGYPRRALRLQDCARAVCERYDGALPVDYDELTALPGIGDYTASAVLSFAYGVRISVIDTNVRRVLSRLIVGEESLGGAATAAQRALADRVLPQDAARSVVWNQSVMELGAVVCTAKSPRCEECPVHRWCAFLAAGRPGLGERRTRPRQRFAGTDRQVRGLVLAALRDLRDQSDLRDGSDGGDLRDGSDGGDLRDGSDGGGELARGRLEALWGDHIQLDRCIASLDEDGLIEILPGGAVRLPRA